MTDLIEARDAITDAVDRALSLAAKEASEHVHQLDLLKARVAELEARVAELEAERRVWVPEPEPEPKRVVVRGVNGRCNDPAMAEPGGNPSEFIGRIAVMWDHGQWSLYRDGAGVLPVPATEAQAIAWCLDGTLPKPVDGPVDLG